MVTELVYHWLMRFHGYGFPNCVEACLPPFKSHLVANPGDTFSQCLNMPQYQRSQREQHYLDVLSWSAKNRKGLMFTLKLSVKTCLRKMVSPGKKVGEEHHQISILRMYVWDTYMHAHIRHTLMYDSVFNRY